MRYLILAMILLAIAIPAAENGLRGPLALTYDEFASIQ